MILLGVRWYLRYGLSYRDMEELLAERGIDVDYVTLFRWVQRFTPLLIYAARPCQHGQVIGVFVSKHRDIASARTFFATSLLAHRIPTEVITDRAAALANVTPDLIPAAFHNTGQYENNRCEADHGRLKTRLRPQRDLLIDRTASVVTGGRAPVQNIRHAYDELGVEASPVFRLAAAFDELQLAI